MSAGLALRVETESVISRKEKEMFVGEVATFCHEDWWVTIDCPRCGWTIQLDCAPYTTIALVPTERRRVACHNCSCAIEFTLLAVTEGIVKIRLTGLYASSRLPRQ